MQLPCASVSKRVPCRWLWLAWKWTWSENAFSYEWFRTNTRFRTEAIGNSEVTYMYFRLFMPFDLLLRSYWLLSLFLSWQKMLTNSRRKSFLTNWSWWNPWRLIKTLLVWLAVVLSQVSRLCSEYRIKGLITDGGGVKGIMNVRGGVGGGKSIRTMGFCKNVE